MKQKNNNILFAIILNIIITISQIIGSFLSGSLSLLSDAVHNFSDIVALIITYWSNILSLRKEDSKKTFGYKRAQILATLFNASTLFGIAIFLIFQAIEHFFNPQIIDSLIVIVLGIASIILNFISMLLLKKDSKKSMNMQAAYLHLMSDVFTSFGVVVGGVLMYYFGLFWIDPLLSILIALYLIKASYGLIIKSIEILMQSTPVDINMDDIKKDIESFNFIQKAFHFHIWKLDDHDIYFEASLNYDKNLNLKDVTKINNQISKKIQKKYNITHITFQSQYIDR